MKKFFYTLNIFFKILISCFLCLSIIASTNVFSEEISLTKSLKAEHATESIWYTQGQTISVSSSIEYNYTNIVVIGLEIAIPDQWTFNSYTTETSPITAPRKGDQNLLSFSWTSIPVNTLHIAYQLDIPANSTGEKEIASLVKYRLGTVGQHLYEDVSPNPLKIYSQGFFITASAGQGGSITPEGNTFVLPDADQAFTIQTDFGYTINSLLVDNQSVQPGDYIFEEVSSDHSISVSFILKQYQVSISTTEGGNITPYGALIIEHGAAQSFQIISDKGYELAQVQVDDIPISVINHSFSINIMADTDIYVQFRKKMYTINSDSSDNGTITPSGEVNVFYNENKVFTFIPDNEYKLQALLIDGIDNFDDVNKNQYVFEAIESDHNIYALFALADPIEIDEPGIESTLVYHMPLPSISIDDIYVVANKTIDIKTKSNETVAIVYIDTGSLIVESAEMVILSYTLREGLSSISNYISESDNKLLEFNFSHAVIDSEKGIILTIPSSPNLSIDDFMGEKPELSIFHAPTKENLYAGINIKTIPPEDIQTIDEIGTITFKTKSLSVFSVGKNEYEDNTVINSSSDDSGGGCFISTVTNYLSL